jgi:PAS domain S-box-containing protein
MPRFLNFPKRQDKLTIPSKEWRRLLIDETPVAFAAFDRNMRYLCASRRWLTDYNLDGRDLRGMSHYDVFPELPDAWKEAYCRGVAGETLRSEGDRFERSSGSVQWIRWQIKPWQMARGGIGGICIFSEDITQHMLATELLRSAETKSRRIVESAMDAIISVDEEQRVVFFNPAAERVFPCAASEACWVPRLIALFPQSTVKLIASMCETLAPPV